jgi:hypothetical protein
MPFERLERKEALEDRQKELMVFIFKKSGTAMRAAPT